MRYLLAIIFPIRDSLRLELRNNLFRNWLTEKFNCLLDEFCQRLWQNLYVCNSLKKPNSVWQIASPLVLAEEQEVGR